MDLTDTGARFLAKALETNTVNLSLLLSLSLLLILLDEIDIDNVQM